MKYGDRAASARQRFLQFFPYIGANGISIDAAPLLDNRFLERRFAGDPIPLNDTVKAYFRRMRHLLSDNSDYDALWLQYELFPYLPDVFERLATRPGVPIVVDYDDAIFHQYDAHHHAPVRLLLGHKLEYLVRRAETVVCGNSYVESWARKLGGQTARVPTVLDIDHFSPCESKTNEMPVIGWIGSPSTSQFLVPLFPVLESLVRDGSASIRAVGAGPSIDGIAFLDAVSWSESGEVSDIQGMDIGIMPVDDTPFARGKCGYKLIQYMACGLPVVASPVGVNTEIVEHGVNGFLATSPEDWKAALTILMNEPGLRRQMGRQGRKKVEKEFSLQVHGPRVAQLLREVVEHSRG